MREKKIMYRVGQVVFALASVTCLATFVYSEWWVFAVLFLAFASGYFSGGSVYMRPEETP